jgi:oligopeptide transport system substrate-binding protein
MGILETIRNGAAVAALTFALVGSAAAQTTLNRALDSDPTTLDPHKTSTVTDAHVLRDLYEGLVIHDMRGQVQPGVAESWTRSADGRVYTFRFRGNAVWSNGDPVRPADFIFSVRRIADPATAAQYASILYPIRGVEAFNRGQGGTAEGIGMREVDARTLEITLERPTPFFLELLTHQTALPVHPASVRQHGDNFVRPGNKVSNGAYTLTDYQAGSHVRLSKNPRYHDAANVRIDVVNHIPVRDLAAGARRFIAGELHLTVDIPADQLRQLRQQLGEQVQVNPLLGTHYFVFNTRKAPFNDRRVRQALSMTVDREFLAEQIWNGTALPAYSFVPPGTNNYGEPPRPSWAALSTIEREDRARALLREAGFGPNNPLRVQIRFNMTDNNRATMVAVADMWKQIGVEVSQISTDGRTHFAYLRDGNDFDVARAGWIADYNDPQNFLFLLETATGQLNYARWSNAQYDALMRRAQDETDLTVRANTLKDAERIMQEEVPYAAFLYFTNRNLVSPRVQGFFPNARAAFATRFISLRAN